MNQHTELTNNQTFPFPFIGAGYGNYYEWAEVNVRFVTRPNNDQMEKIIKLAPSPIKPEADDFRGRMLLAGSPQNVHMYIQEAYDDPTAIGKAAEEFESEELDDYDEDLPLFIASKKALDAFEADIESWLLKIHAFCPIEFVCRMEDTEAGGTELSDWHRGSLESIPGLIQQWEQAPDTYQQSEEERALFGHSVKAIFQYGNVDLETPAETLAEYLFPELLLEKLFDKPDVSKALAFYRKHSENKYIIRTAGKLVRNLCHKNEYAKVVRLTEEALDAITQDYSFMLVHMDKIAFAAVMENNQALIDRLVQRLSNQQSGSASSSGDCASCDYANNIGLYAFKLHTKDTYIQSRRMYEIALDIQPPQPCTQRLEVFCNALWILQHDNTGLPVDKALNEKFLAKCLPYAPGNPAIFFNAVCVYVEMKEFDKALECYNQAIDFKYSGIQMMKDQIQGEKMFSEFKKYPPLIAALTR